MCVAGGLELVLFRDLIWAAEGTSLGLFETRLGIVPLAGGIESVAARGGIGRARSIALSGNLFTAEQFEAWGIVDRVLPAASCSRRPRSSLSGWPQARPEPSPRSSDLQPPTPRAESGPLTSACSRMPSPSSTPTTHGTRSTRSSRPGLARQHSPGVDHPFRLRFRNGLSPARAAAPGHSGVRLGGGG